MRIILFLIVVSLITALGFLIAFFWAVKSGQYDDDVTPSIRLMFEEDMIKNKENQNIINK